MNHCMNIQDRLATPLIYPDDSGDGSQEHAYAGRQTDSLGEKRLNAYTIPTTPVANSEFVLPTRPKSRKIVGA